MLFKELKSPGFIKNDSLNNSVLRTLLYYDIFSHPLSGDEIYTFLPQNSVTREQVKQFLKKSSEGGALYAEKDGYYYIKPNEQYVSSRLKKEDYSKKMWKAAWAATHIIKRFPFVRCVMVTGTLSKNSSDHESDLDFMIITSPNRLWISRTLLMLFKKIFLLNSKKYFCINYCITENSLEIKQRNIFTATEIATIKATYNESLTKEFVQKNSWVKEIFPNYIINDETLHKAGCKVQQRRSIIQKTAELFFAGKFGDWLDTKLMNRTNIHWRKKYPQMNDDERYDRLRTTPTESKTHPHSVHEKILTMYKEKLSGYDLLFSILPLYFCLFAI